MKTNSTLGRRDFLKAGIGAAVAMGSAWPLSVCRGLDATRVKQLTMGFEMELGEIRAESIEVLGEELENVRVEWKPARLKGHRANG